MGTCISKFQLSAPFILKGMKDVIFLSESFVFCYTGRHSKFWGEKEQK